MNDDHTETIDEIMRELMKFTPQQRVELAERLIESVPPFSDDPELEREWNEEIARRVDEIDEGRVKLIPAEEVHAEIKEKLRLQRMRND